MLILHIGLPKTGSTFLQREVFPKMEKTLLLHRSMPPLGRIPILGEKFMYLLRVLIHAQNPNTRKLGQLVFRLISVRGRVLISNENFSMRPSGVWTNAGIGPESFAKWLSEIKEKSNKPVKVIFGIRKWDDWLASRYAQSASHFDDPGQQDFEERARKVLKEELSPDSVYGWLDYERVIASFREVLGEGNLMIYRTEDLEVDRYKIVHEAFEFVGLEIPEELRDPLAWSDIRKRNVRRTSVNSWKLRRSKAQIVMTSELKAEILDKFGDYERTSSL